MNDDLRDFELKSDEPESSPNGEGPGTPRWPYLAAVAVVILVVVAFFFFRQGKPLAPPEASEAAPPAAAEPTDASESEQDLIIGEVPLLVDSDAWLRQILAQISSHPQLAEWLVTPELIRGFVVVVDNVAEGVSPRKHLEMAIPDESFGVDESDGRIYVDPATHHRFDLLVDVIDSLDTAGTAELYRAIRPLCQQAYQDLGYPGDDFDAILRRAVQRLLATPVVDGPVELERKVTAYQFADPALEELSPAAKQFLRLGPENLTQLQAKVRALSRAIGLDQ